MLPFGRISPAAKPRVRSSAPPFGFAAQNRARHFAAHSLGGRPLRGHGFATPHRYFAVPVTAAPRRGPNGKNPALFGYFLNTKKVTPSADSVIVPAKAGDFPLFPHAASAFNPALAPVRSHFACGETARPVVASAGAGAEAALPKAPPLTLPAQGPASRDFR